MNYPLILGGKELYRTTFESASNFYPEYTYHIANANPLDIASAIGAARQAESGTITQRIILLEKAAHEFTYSQEDVEHAVRMTGMPIQLISNLFKEIPEILRSIPQQFKSRFTLIGKEKPYLAEKIGHHLYKALLPKPGFCYAITPGNDPRATAIVAANLACLGIPFIIRASIRDAAAPLVVQALISGGFDPRFAQLLYLDREDPLSNQNHARLVEACSIIWTFGPPAIIDRTLRFQSNPPRTSVNLEGVAIDPGDFHALRTTLVGWSPEKLDRRLQFESSDVDMFTGKMVLRHASGNCATIAFGNLTDQTRDWLYTSIGYAIVCTATKSVMSIHGEKWVEQAAQYLHSLVIGDPLDPQTQIGYIDPNCLDILDGLRQKNSSRATFYGGERLSPFQATPLLVHSQADLPDFFAREIPAYVLAIRHCKDLPDGIDLLNHYNAEQPRLAVSLMNIPESQLRETILSLHAQTILLNKPTTLLAPALHEGNDYALLLSSGKLIVI